SKIVTQDVYHVLKAIAHVPFGIYLNLEPASGGNLPGETIEKLKDYQSKILAARDDLMHRNLKPEQQQRLSSIIQTSLDFIGATLTSGKVSEPQLENFAHSVGPLMYQSASEAGCLQIQAMHAAILEWRKTLGCSEWGKVFFLNRGMHQARYRNVGTQYF